MQAITRVNHIGLRISELERSRVFYSKLGFDFVAGPLGPEPVAIMENEHGININFILNAKQDEPLNHLMDVAEKYTGYTHVALEVDSVAQMQSDLAEQGIELSGGPMHHPTGSSIFIRDPDRNVIEFVEYQGLDKLKLAD
ncbi:VOC family protein [Agaribacterium sp. ZY112]|uniref:VOC family protein n=1 Tax=Agaribacterium sp. ZY112 TaxID=3233574 RepID=UPI003525159A